jgi:hypothetical protein
MKYCILSLFFVLNVLAGILDAQMNQPMMTDDSTTTAHSILPSDGIIEYLPLDSVYKTDHLQSASGRIRFTPLINFFFRPEGTSDYKEAGLPIDTGHLNFYLRGDFGGKISLPKNIDMVFNLQSYGSYTRSLGPLDPNLSLYEAYVDMKKLDRNGRLSLRFGRMSLGKYGAEILVGNDDFTKGRSFESIRLRYKRDRWTSDVMWVQLYQAAPPAANFDWNHPIFLSTFNTFNFSNAVNLDVNLPYVIDQYNSGFRTSVFMPDVRFFGLASNFRYSAEFILQTGSALGILDETIKGTVNSYAAEISAGYVPDNGKISFDLAYYLGSGDDDVTDTDIKSYNILWQNEHRRFGYIDAFKGSNVTATTLHLDWKVGRLVSTGIHGVMANVIEQGDRSTGIAVGGLPEFTTNSTSIGYGGDWYLNYYYNQNLNFQFSASAFRVGEYFNEVTNHQIGDGVDQIMMRLYLMMALRL